MFSEIYYNDTQNNDGEFLEIYNPGTVAGALGGYALAEAVSFVFPAGTSIEPGEYVVIVRKSNNYTGNGYQVFEWTSGKLANEGERILLLDPAGLVADFVRYQSAAPWPDSAATYGKSLELVSEHLDNHFHTSWEISPISPGGPTVGVSGPGFGPKMQLTLFPNPAGEQIQVLVKNTETMDMVLKISNLQGNIVSEKALSGAGDNEQHHRPYLPPVRIPKIVRPEGRFAGYRFFREVVRSVASHFPDAHFEAVILLMFLIRTNAFVHIAQFISPAEGDDTVVSTR